MKKYLLLIIIPALLITCKSKKVTLAENDDKVDEHDFIEFFQPLKLPWQAADSLLKRKESDSSIINNTLFARFVPDSALSKYFGKGGHPHLHAMGKVHASSGETYLFVKASTPSRKALLVICFDKKNKFAVSRAVLYSDGDPGVSGQASMDTKYTLTVNHQRKAAGGQVIYKKDAYVFNGENAFILILTESNEGLDKPVPVYNPIDTLPHHHKFTGDYSQDKRNFISFRDGKDPSRILLFVHFEKDDGNCKGELKGEARFISPNAVRYKSNGDPCTVDFSFTGEGVTMKEVEACGNHRDIKCFFEGYYPKRKEAKPHPTKKKK